MFRKTVYLEVDRNESVLNMRMHPMAESGQMSMLNRLLSVLNETETLFPWTGMVLRYSILDSKV